MNYIRFFTINKIEVIVVALKEMSCSVLISQQATAKGKPNFQHLQQGLRKLDNVFAKTFDCFETNQRYTLLQG